MLLLTIPAYFTIVLASYKWGFKKVMKPLLNVIAIGGFISLVLILLYAILFIYSPW